MHCPTGRTDGVSAEVGFCQTKAELLCAECDALLAGADEHVTDVADMGLERCAIQQAIVDDFGEVGDGRERSIGAAVELVTCRYEALRVTQKPVATPGRDECRQWLGLVRQRDLPVTMSCIKSGEELNVAYVSNHIPRAPGGMDRTANLVVELLEIYGETHSIYSLFLHDDDDDRVVPVRWFGDWFYYALGDDVFQLLLYLVAIRVGEDACVSNMARLRVSLQLDVHRRARHGTKWGVGHARNLFRPVLRQETKST